MQDTETRKIQGYIHTHTHTAQLAHQPPTQCDPPNLAKHRVHDTAASILISDKNTLE